MNIFSSITARTLKQNRRRTILTVAGVVLSTAMITAVTTFGVSLRQFLIEDSIRTNGSWHVAAEHVTEERAAELAADPQVEESACVTELGYALYGLAKDDPDVSPYLFVQSLSEKGLTILPAVIQDGRLPENDGEVIIPAIMTVADAPDSRVQIGDTLTLELGQRMLDGTPVEDGGSYYEGETFQGRESRTYQVVGTYSTWVNTGIGGAAQELLAGPEAAGDTGSEEAGEAYDGGYPVSVYLRLKDPGQTYSYAGEHFSQEEETVFNRGLLRWYGVFSTKSYNTMLISIMAVLIAVIVIGSVSVIYNAFAISLRERTTQFGLLSSVGATRKQLRRCLIYEALFVSAIGIPIGVAAGIGGIGCTLLVIGKDLTTGLLDTDAGISLHVSFVAIAAAVVIALCTVLLSVWIPALRVRRITPLEAIRASYDIRVRPGQVKTARWLEKLLGTEGMLARKNYKRDRKKYRATVFSLTVSIVLFTTAALFQSYLFGAGNMVFAAPEADISYHLYDAEKETVGKAQKIIENTRGVTEVIPSAVYYLAVRIPEEYLSREAAESLREQRQMLVDMNTELSETQEGVLTQQVRIFALEDGYFARYARSMGIDPAAYTESGHLRLLYFNDVTEYNVETERYETGSVFASRPEDMLDAGHETYRIDEAEQEKDSDGAAAAGTDRQDGGETETLIWQFALGAEFGDEATEPLTLLGVYDSDLTCISAVIPSSVADAFRQELTDPDRTSSNQFSILCENAPDAYEQLALNLTDAGLPGARFLENNRQEYDNARRVRTAMLVLTYGFIILLSLTGLVNIFNTMSTNLTLRRREFAMLRSMGMTGRGFRRMMAFECIQYGIQTILCGTVLTVVVSYVMYRIFRQEFSITMTIPWGYLAIAAAGVLAVVAATMAYTMGKLRKENIVEALKEF